MKIVNSEIKKVVQQVRSTQEKLQGLIKNQNWVEEARKYAQKQSKEVKKLLSGDLEKLKGFLEKERHELGKFQKQIPAEVEKIRSFLTTQRKDLEKMIASLRKTGGKSKGKGAKKKRRTSAPRKKTAAAGT